MTRQRVLLLIIAAVLALAACGSSDSDAESTAPGLPPFEDVDGDPGVGMAAPSFTVADLYGEPLTIDATSSTQILGFFVHWCPHCQREVPRLVEYFETNPLPDGVEFVTVSTAVDESRDNFPAADWFERENWPFPVADDADNAIAKGYGMTSFPYFVITDAAGDVVLRVSGEQTEESFAALVDVAAAAS